MCILSPRQEGRYVKGGETSSERTDLNKHCYHLYVHFFTLQYAAHFALWFIHLSIFTFYDNQHALLHTLLGYSELLFTVQTTVELILNYPISKKCHIYQVKKSSEAISSCLHECKTSAHTYNWYGPCLRSWVILSLQSLFSLPEGRQD